MSVQSCGSGFIAQCPKCKWHVFSSAKHIAQELLGVHRCPKPPKERK